jgi:SsrA-binding protein
MSTEISVNRKALRDFHILERVEAGVELKGTEVKSIRSGLANINNAFARVERKQMFLFDADIQPWAKASFEQHAPKRQRRLLLHRKQIDRLTELTQIKGHTLVALRMYWSGANVKVEIGVAKGKEKSDQRADIKARVVKREVDREISRFNKKNA